LPKTSDTIEAAQENKENKQNMSNTEFPPKDMDNINPEDLEDYLKL